MYSLLPKVADFVYNKEHEDQYGHVNHPQHINDQHSWVEPQLHVLCNAKQRWEKRNSILTVIIIFVNDMSKQQPEPESSSSSGIDVRSRESSSGNSYSTATTPASLYETDDYYPVVVFRLPPLQRLPIPWGEAEFYPIVPLTTKLSLLLQGAQIT